jgi:serine O-acetyltransferase
MCTYHFIMTPCYKCILNGYLHGNEVIDMNVIHFYRLAHYLYKKKIPLLPSFIYYVQFLLFNSIVPYTAMIGKGTYCSYGGIGVVIHARAVIGDNCVLGQGITIGGRSKIEDVPVIGNKVYVASGARVLGNVKIGDNAIIGANSVVIKDVPEGSVAAGVPAKIIKTGVTLEDYL